jgi:hypothetical protein
MREEDFYPKKQDYLERANDNLAGWLGLQHLTTIDVFVLLPLFLLGGLALAREDAENYRRRLPAVLRIRVVALSCTLLANITCRNYRCWILRRGSEERREGAAFDLRRGRRTSLASPI